MLNKNENFCVDDLIEQKLAAMKSNISTVELIIIIIIALVMIGVIVAFITKMIYRRLHCHRNNPNDTSLVQIGDKIYAIYQ